MMKECATLNGQIINIGPWDYLIQPFELESPQYNDKGELIKEGVYEDRPTNPFPEGAVIEQRDFEHDPERGWHETGTTVPDPDAELAAAIQAATTLTELKAALLGSGGKTARVKGKLK